MKINKTARAALRARFNQDMADTRSQRGKAPFFRYQNRRRQKIPKHAVFLVESMVVFVWEALSMFCWYHGTVHGEEILQSGHFRSGTYFAKHLEDALGYGGYVVDRDFYIFEVLFDEVPSTYWEWRNVKPIPVSMVQLAYKVDIVPIVDSEEAEARVTKSFIEETFGVPPCKSCNGRGSQCRVAPFSSLFGEDQLGEVCGECKGHGYLRPRGERIWHGVKPPWRLRVKRLLRRAGLRR